MGVQVDLARVVEATVVLVARQSGFDAQRLRKVGRRTSVTVADSDRRGAMRA